MEGVENECCRVFEDVCFKGCLRMCVLKGV